MNTTLNQWINNLYRHGAIDVGGRDELKERLNIRCEDFETVVADMDKYIRYMTPSYQKKWAALIAENFPRVERAALYAIEEPTSEEWARLHALDLKLGY